MHPRTMERIQVLVSITGPDTQFSVFYKDVSEELTDFLACIEALVQ